MEKDQKVVVRALIFIDGSEAQFGDLVKLVGLEYARRYVTEGVQEAEYKGLNEITFRFEQKHDITIRRGEVLPIFD